MGLFKKRAAADPKPSLTSLAMPDPNWTRKNLRDVAAMIEAHEHYKTRAEVQIAGAVLGSTLTFDMPPEVEQALGRDAVIGSVQASAIRGYAFAALHPSSPTTRYMHDAVQWSAYLTAPHQLRDISLLHIFACHVGHYLGHNGGQDMAVLDQMDWPTVLRLSPRATVVCEMMEEGWANLCVGKWPPRSYRSVWEARARAHQRHVDGRSRRRRHCNGGRA